MINFAVTLDGIEKVKEQFGPNQSDTVTNCARMAINDTIRRAYAQSKQFMYDNVNFPSGYLDREDRLSIKNHASNSNLEATIFARFEPTSLARFAMQTKAQKGIMVHVKNSAPPKTIRTAFFMGLRSGNTGLIVRSVGEPNKAYKPKQMKNPELWAVYGPSVYQVFRNWLSQNDNEAKIAQYLEDRFQHHLKRMMP